MNKLIEAGLSAVLSKRGYFLSSIVVIVSKNNGPIRIPVHYLGVFLQVLASLVGQEEGFRSVKDSISQSECQSYFVNFQNPNIRFSERKQTFLKW